MLVKKFVTMDFYYLASAFVHNKYNFIDIYRIKNRKVEVWLLGLGKKSGKNYNSISLP